MLPAQTRRGGSGFTALELMAVVVVIALAAIIVLPAVQASRQLAVRTQCQGNLRAIGLAVASYSASHNFSLPPYHGDGAILFDTLAMRRDTGQMVNLGALLAEMDQRSVFYCPSQTADRSPCIACDSPQNRWQLSPAASGPSGGGKKGASAPAPSEAWLSSSYAARFRHAGDVQLPAWTILNHANKAIYSDFIGVDEWPGRGRFSKPLRAAHGSTGYNRLFGDGAVLWTPAEQLDELRPVTAAEPTAEELSQYWLWHDVLR